MLLGINNTTCSIQDDIDELKNRYCQLKARYIQKSEKYNRAKKDHHLLSKQIRRWSRDYQRLKITLAATTIEGASFEEYSASVEPNYQELQQLKKRVQELSIKNNELQEKLELGKLHIQSASWGYTKSKHTLFS